MQNPLRVAIKMPLARQRHSERSVGERIVNGEASSQRERGHLAHLFNSPVGRRGPRRRCFQSFEPRMNSNGREGEEALENGYWGGVKRRLFHPLSTIHHPRSAPNSGKIANFSSTPPDNPVAVILLPIYKSPVSAPSTPCVRSSSSSSVALARSMRRRRWSRISARPSGRIPAWLTSPTMSRRTSPRFR